MVKKKVIVYCKYINTMHILNKIYLLYTCYLFYPAGAGWVCIIVGTLCVPPTCVIQRRLNISMTFSIFIFRFVFLYSRNYTQFFKFSLNISTSISDIILQQPSQTYHYRVNKKSHYIYKPQKIPLYRVRKKLYRTSYLQCRYVL